LGILSAAQFGDGKDAWLWAFFFITFAVVIPVLFIVWQLQRGRLTDFHLRVRKERFVPMMVQLVSLAGAIILMAVFSTPGLLLMTAIWGASLTAFLLLITLFWKISGHSTAAASFAVFMFIYYGYILTPVFILIPVVAWARVRIKRHTVAQVLAGTITGLVFTTAFMFLVHLFYPGVL
jgi:membrane-associated phospholipid phosphatase